MQATVMQLLSLSQMLNQMALTIMQLEEKDFSDSNITYGNFDQRLKDVNLDVRFMKLQVDEIVSEVKCKKANLDFIASLPEAAAKNADVLLSSLIPDVPTGARLRSCLGSCNIHKVSDLFRTKRSKFIEEDGVGKKSMQILDESLAKIGVVWS